MAGNTYSNKWLSTSLPYMNNFNVNKSHTKYYIFYWPAQKNVIELNSDMNAIKNAVKKLQSDIEALKGAIDSEDMKSKTAELNQAVNDAVSAIDSNMTKLFEACARRLENAAATDAWFGTSAGQYANNIRQNILSKR